jgi:hypothetical protein
MLVAGRYKGDKIKKACGSVAENSRGYRPYKVQVTPLKDYIEKY